MSETNNIYLKFNKPTKFLIVFISILIIIKLIEISNNNFYKCYEYNAIGFPMSKVKQNCISNMKTLEGATELYNMENKQICNISVDELVNKGYLKTTPYCKTYKNIFLWLYCEELINSYNIVNLTEEINVQCPIHGKLKK